MNLASRKNDPARNKKAEAARSAAIEQLQAAKARPGRWLRQWRSDHNMSQAILAPLLGVSLRTLIRWEQVEELPRLVTVALEGK